MIIKYISMIKYKYMIKVFQEMEKFNYVIIKGEVLSLQAYGEYGMRSSSDIDILVSKDDLIYVEKILFKNGFKKHSCSRKDEVFLLSSSHQVMSWFKEIEPWGTIEIDLNFDIFWGEYSGEKINIKEFLKNSIKYNIYNANIKALPPLKSFIQLVLHTYKDINSIFLLAVRKKINRNSFKDIYNLWKNNIEEININDLYFISLKYNIIPYVYYILYFTNMIYNDCNLEKYIIKFYTAEGEKMLNYYGLDMSEKHEWKIDFFSRIECEDIFEIIKQDLSDKDFKKIDINKRIFFNDDNR